MKNSPFREFFISNALRWRLPTLPLRVPSALPGLTSGFGMRPGVAPASSHQREAFDCSPIFENFMEGIYLQQTSGAQNSPQEIRRISTPRLNTLQCVHLEPINVIISYGPQTIPYLEAGFPLRCFQRLSYPNIATQRSCGCKNCHTRGWFTPVLSY